MINPKKFIDILIKKKCNFFTGVPDSCSSELWKVLKRKKTYVAANEGSAVALAIGNYLSNNRLPVVLFQNSGLGNATDPLTNLCSKAAYNIPMLLLIGWRGAPCIKDEPQHVIQGKSLVKILNLYKIKHFTLGNKLQKDKINNLINYSKGKSQPVAILIKPKTFLSFSRKKDFRPKKNSINRSDVIKKLFKHISNKTKIVSSVGFNSRELMQMRIENKIKKGKDFYMIGGMGHTFSVSLGLAMNLKQNIVCLDGDGSFFMHLGSMALNKILMKNNLKYIVLDNNSHESVGNVSFNYNLNFQLFSKAFGFKKFYEVNTISQLKKKFSLFFKSKGPSFLYIKTNTENNKQLIRPKNLHSIKKKFIIN